MINNLLDILLILIVVYNILRGWQSGFITGVIDLASWIGSLYAAFRLYPYLMGWLGTWLVLSESIARPLAFILVAMVAGIVLSLVGRLVNQRFPARVHTHDVNRIFGVLTGLVSGLIAVAILSALLLALPLSGNLRVAARDSGLANHFGSLTQQLESQLNPIFGDAISQSLNLITIHPESNELVDLPYTVTNAVPVPELEVEMLQLLNAERAKNGLSPLEMDSELIAVARQHSHDMLQRGYFAHTTPEGITPFDRIQGAGIEYRIAGENLAHAPTLSIAHTGLMNSPSHRENILRAEFGRVGIGILDSGSHGLMVTQNFRD